MYDMISIVVSVDGGGRVVVVLFSGSSVQDHVYIIYGMLYAFRKEVVKGMK